MVKEYRYSQLACQFCVGKNHCAQCAEDIAAMLRAMPGVAFAEADAPNRRLRVDYDGADVEDIEDRMDAAGVFLS